MQMNILLAFLFLLASGTASAQESINICYHYSCSKEATARFTETRLHALANMLRSSHSAEEERKALATVIGQLYYWAGQQTPVHADKGGNFSDDAADGAMDCIDHSTTTMRFLKMLERRDLLRYHKVDEVVRRRRFILFEHFSAVIAELPRPMQASGDDDFMGGDKQHQYVVDSWFVNNGEPAVILPLESWMDGAGQAVEPSL